ncbi:unnamed protein product [Rotaria socialis]|uniref:Uncharacterized protein n=1 Tax=Rotaria socialis TaxID=392032 RepID=A0A821GE60_9BILA|nr:unnamed protein product [Rotaria socialis]CAF4665663.1 unnamed protein product [Rotaria socialis]
MKDEWIDGSDNSKDYQRCFDVIWLGEVASILTENHFKSVIRRVVYPRIQHQSLITIWHEVGPQLQIVICDKPFDKRNLLLNRSNLNHLRKLDENRSSRPHPQQKQNNRTFLLPGALVNMNNQPNLVPMRSIVCR